MILLAPLSDEVYNVQHLELRGIYMRVQALQVSQLLLILRVYMHYVQ